MPRKNSRLTKMKAARVKVRASSNTVWLSRILRHFDPHCTIGPDRPIPKWKLRYDPSYKRYRS